MEVGLRIRQLRRDKGLTQDQLGAHVKIDGRQLSRYESGKVQPTVKVLAKIAEFFGLEPQELYTASSSPKAQAQAFQDKELFQQMLEVDQLDEDDRHVAKRVLQALLMKKQMQELLGGTRRSA